MSRKGSVLREFPILVIVALAVSLLIKTFIVQFFYIPSGSMENTLQVQDRVAVNKLPFISKNISRGDVVVFRDPSNWLPEQYVGEENKIITKIKEGLVLVGVLPNPAKQFLVKRVIGVAGDKVVCCAKNGKLKINGVEADEPYIFKGNEPSEMKFNVDVPKGFVFVLGDHRGASSDSRFHSDRANNGMVPLSKVVGRATFIVWPLSNIAFIPKGDDLEKVKLKD